MVWRGTVRAPGEGASALVRCPVCDSTTVTVILNSRSDASCAECGATWIQEGSWQRAVRPRRPKLTEDVIRLPGPAERPARERTEGAGAEEAVAT